MRTCKSIRSGAPRHSTGRPAILPRLVLTGGRLGDADLRVLAGSIGLVRRGLRAAVPSVCLALVGCGVLDHGFLKPAGPVASGIRSEFLWVSAIMLFVIVPVLLLVPLIGWHYRLSNTKSAYRPQWGFNWSLEGLIWIPPTIIVIVIAVFLWRDTHRLDPYRPLGGEAIDVQVVALDWKWLFIYPAQGVATVDRLVIPAGRPVHLSLTSATVMQSFMLPRLAGQIYAMAGMRTQLNFLADAPGLSWGENVQFNGTGFQTQKFKVEALDAGAFQSWLADTKAQPNRLGRAQYQILSRRSLQPQPLAFGTVDPGLFDRIVGLTEPSGHTIDLQKAGDMPPRALPMETSKK